MTDITRSEIRKQLLRNGYSPLPGLDKQCKLKGWSGDFLRNEKERLGSLEAAIETWDDRFPKRLTTNVLVRDGLVVIDGDIDDRELMAQLKTLLKTIVPEVYAFAPMRYGSGTHKAAWFCRLDDGEEPFARRGTHKFVRPEALAAFRADETERPPYHHCEIFGGELSSKGKAVRQFGVYGPHTVASGDKPEILYRWDTEGDELAAVPLSELPVITGAQVWDILRRFEAIAGASGWEQLPKSGGEDAIEGGVLLDIDREKTLFETAEHEWIDYAEVERRVAIGEDVRLWATFIPGEQKLTESPDRCQAMLSDKYHCVMIYDHKLRNTHLPSDAKSDPSQHTVTTLMRTLEERLPPSEAREPSEPEEVPSEPPEPEYQASMADKVTWLLETYGYFMSEDTIVRIWDTSLDCRSKPSAFTRRFAAWYELQEKGRTVVEVRATDLWEKMPIRRHLAGVRMRPDMGFPMYSEGGQLFKNSYRRPVHGHCGGDVGPFLRFMERFLPARVEREWLYKWLAHKQARPDVPGTAVVFVADATEGIREGIFGTGRGLLFRIVRKLYGEAYTRAQSFSILEGSNGQSVFNDWLHGSVLITVDESKSSATSYRRGERSATYEVLKDLVDPSPKLFNFKGKYRQAFDGMSYASFMIASNHADALAIPAEDRRFTVLRNGRKMTPEEAREIDAWMEQPANIAALSRWLATQSLAGFQMREPLVTEAKGDMADMALSDVDELLRDFMADETLGKVFTKKHFEVTVARHFNASNTYWVGELKAAWSRYCVGLRDEIGAPRRVKSEGTRRKLFCFRSNLTEVNAMPQAAVRREAGKWGHVDGLKDPLHGLRDVGSTEGSTEEDE